MPTSKIIAETAIEQKVGLLSELRVYSWILLIHTKYGKKQKQMLLSSISRLQAKQSLVWFSPLSTNFFILSFLHIGNQMGKIDKAVHLLDKPTRFSSALTCFSSYLYQPIKSSACYACKVILQIAFLGNECQNFKSQFARKGHL